MNPSLASGWSSKYFSTIGRKGFATSGVVGQQMRTKRCSQVLIARPALHRVSIKFIGVQCQWFLFVLADLSVMPHASRLFGSDCVFPTPLAVFGSDDELQCAIDPMRRSGWHKIITGQWVGEQQCGSHLVSCWVGVCGKFRHLVLLRFGCCRLPSYT